MYFCARGCLRTHGRRQAWARGGALAPPWKCANGYLQPQSGISSTQNAPKLAFFSSKIAHPTPISISNEIKTSPKLTSQYMPLSGLSQFPFNSASKNSTQNAPKLAFFSSKIEKFSGEGATPSPYLTPFGASTSRHSAPLFLPPCKKFWRRP